MENTGAFLLLAVCFWLLAKKLQLPVHQPAETTGAEINLSLLLASNHKLQAFPT
jgi:hypothetical protein